MAVGLGFPVLHTLTRRFFPCTVLVIVWHDFLLAAGIRCVGTRTRANVEHPPVATRSRLIIAIFVHRFMQSLLALAAAGGSSNWFLPDGAKGSRPGQFFSPDGIAVDRSGVSVADTGNGRFTINSPLGSATARRRSLSSRKHQTRAVKGPCRPFPADR